MTPTFQFGQLFRQKQHRQVNNTSKERTVLSLSWHLGLLTLRGFAFFVVLPDVSTNEFSTMIMIYRQVENQYVSGIYTSRETAFKNLITTGTVPVSPSESKSLASNAVTALNFATRSHGSGFFICTEKVSSRWRQSVQSGTSRVGTMLRWETIRSAVPTNLESIMPKQ